MKPYSNAILTKEQRYFNYRLSIARIVVEGAFGQLKGRGTLRKNKCHTDTLKSMSLACIILHNVCIDLEDQGNRGWDLTVDETTQKRRPREVVRDMLHMTKCRKIPDSSRNNITKVVHVSENHFEVNSVQFYVYSQLNYNISMKYS